MSDSSKQENLEIITLGGGCFWCLEPLFDDLKGVVDVVSGYSGGHARNPSYAQVCTGTTGHAEVIQVTFNPKEVSLNDLLVVFFTMHDPTTLNRQGADIGTQYRSVIFYRDAHQKRIAEEVIAEIKAERLWNNPIVTELAPFEVFYEAEDYHQEYYLKNPNQGYCRVVIDPKVSKFRKKFAERLKS